MGAAGGALARTAAESPARVFLARFHKETSQRAMGSSLRAILSAAGLGAESALDFPWHALTYEGATALRAALATRYKPRSLARHLAALVGVLKVAVRMGLYDERTLSHLCDRTGPLHTPAIDTAPAGRMLTADEVFKVIDAASSRRDMAILALAAYTGLRRFEISSLDLSDVNFEAAELRVQGKGDKERRLPLPGGALARLEEWVSQRGQRAGPLFYRAERGGGLRQERLSPSGVYDVVIAACKQLKARATPHDFRRTFASTLFDTGTDIVTVKDMMGHANVETTARYDRRGDARKKRAAAALDGIFRRQ